MDTRRIFTVITPEGSERVLGIYKSDRTAKVSFVRRYAADWRGLASGPIRQREPRLGEKVRRGQEWNG